MLFACMEARIYEGVCCDTPPCNALPVVHNELKHKEEYR